MTTTSSGHVRLTSRFRARFPELSLDWTPSAPPHPELVVLNEPLAELLGLDAGWLRSPKGTAFLVGGSVVEGSQPVAMAYAGHQFGGYSPRLGDGRAVLLGELLTGAGDLLDLHLKGSGRTPFARGGDGQAGVGPMLREFLMSEAMHAIGVPSTRALSVGLTGTSILRDGPEPGAVLARVATSHLRVGTFEYAARLGSETLVPRLIAEAIDRHHPGAGESPNQALALLAAVADSQAELVARWMLVGFVHGVMNTDNMAISGETIDYGPCAFIDAYDPAAVFSSIDHGGRYAFGRQAAVAQWNLSRFAETLLPSISSDPQEAVRLATEELEAFPGRHRRHFVRLVAAKLGLPGGPVDVVESLSDGLLSIMGDRGADFTSTFRALGEALRGETSTVAGLAAGEDLHGWLSRWRAAVAETGRPVAEAAAGMDAVNPLYTPRNHLVAEALNAAMDGDVQPFRRLLAVVTNPYTEQPDAERYAQPAPAAFTAGFRTFCGT